MEPASAVLGFVVTGIQVIKLVKQTLGDTRDEPKELKTLQDRIADIATSMEELQRCHIPDLFQWWMPTMPMRWGSFTVSIHAPWFVPRDASVWLALYNSDIDGLRALFLRGKPRYTTLPNTETLFSE